MGRLAELGSLGSMSTIRTSPLPSSVLSWASVLLSVLWFVAAWRFHVVNRTDKDGWSGASVTVLAALIVLPLLAMALLPFVWNGRRTAEHRLRVLDTAHSRLPSPRWSSREDGFYGRASRRNRNMAQPSPLQPPPRRHCSSAPRSRSVAPAGVR